LTVAPPAADPLQPCVHCGFCLPACPTYRVVGSELDSPRGRIYLVKQLVEGAPSSGTTRHHLDRCLTCRACERACPSGVQYGRLIDLGRELAESRAPRSRTERWFRFALTETLSRRALVAVAVRAGQWLHPLLPRRLRDRVPPRSKLPEWPPVRHARRMIVLEGCVQPALAPSINVAAARVLDRVGVSLVRLRDEACCGALCHHLGRTDEALRQARRNVDACCALLDEGAEAIVSTTSACGLMVKDYARLLATDPGYAARARRVSEATRDLSEVLSASDLARLDSAGARGVMVAWQAPCTLQHGQAIVGRVEALLEAAGYRLTSARDATMCCGSAGTYSLLQPELSAELRARKVETLLGGRPSVIATANIGCLEHLRVVCPVPVRHWVELVEEALAGGTETADARSPAHCGE
jgi:glycolate oxidase iron-sulfur subunit